MLLLLTVAAFAFDTGQMMVSRRTQQDVSDAAALAGARELLNPADTNCTVTPSPANCPHAVAAALQLAQVNGFGDGVTNCATASCAGNQKVFVKIPPGPEAPEWFNTKGTVEVQIGNTDPAIFAGVLGIPNWNVAAMAVAANGVDVALSYSFLALDPSCGTSVLLTGSNGSGITAGGNVQVDASCAGALKVSGNSSIDVTSGACNVVGSVQKSGNATVDCTVNNGSPYVPDPLASLAAPSEPALAQAPVNVDNPTAAPPASCPSQLASPATCTFSASYAGTRWELFPGTYPGGLKLNGGTFYMEPGIYYIAGGGLAAGGNGVTLMTVDSGTIGPSPTPGGGILIYNTQDIPSGSTACSGAGCIGPIVLDGSTAVITLLPYQLDPYKGMVIFQDRTLSVSGTTTGGTNRTPDLQLNGGSSNLSVTGTIYMPLGMVQVNGSNSTAMDTQIIAYDFKFNGNGGNMNVGYQGSSFFHVRGSGLVQ
jgi:Flp pilus assembly protein TadG